MAHSLRQSNSDVPSKENQGRALPCALSPPPPSNKRLLLLAGRPSWRSIGAAPTMMAMTPAPIVHGIFHRTRICTLVSISLTVPRLLQLSIRLCGLELFSNPVRTQNKTLVRKSLLRHCNDLNADKTLTEERRAQKLAAACST